VEGIEVEGLFWGDGENGAEGFCVDGMGIGIR
jgi:hypothetical protein